MTTFAVTDPAHTIGALNYVLSNLGSGNVSGNVTIPGNVLVANTTTGAISTYGNASVIAYQNEFLNVRYANNATGSSGFSTNQANSQYFGVYNTVTNTDPGVSNPTNYQWTQVSGGFGTTKTLYYLCNGGRQVQLSATTTAPSSGFLPTINGTPIDLDIVTTANGTPGTRGAIAMGYVITPNDPNTSGNTALSTWFTASRTANVPPIGTGLTPVTGDTADFFYPVTGVSGCFTFDGSGWANVVPQVIPGNTIVNGTITGNTIANNTITGQNIIVGSVSGDRITANTLSGNTIIANTIFGNAIIANTLAGNTIIANTLFGNAIIAGTISGNAIIANSFTANTINGSAIVAGSIAANTINGNSIVSGSITTDQLAANVLTANTVVSTGATIGNFASPGFWLQGSTGNARFGNTVSIGNQLTIGNNASIGGNLTVSGLIINGGLDSNTVATTTIVPSAVTTSDAVITTRVLVKSTANANTTYTYAGPSVTTTVNNQKVIVWWQAGGEFILYTTPTGGTVYGQMILTLNRYLTSSGGPGTTIFQTSLPFQQTNISNLGTSVYYYNIAQPTYVDIVSSPGLYTYAWGIQLQTSFTLNLSRIDLYLTNLTSSPTGQIGSALNSMAALGTKR